MLNYILWGILLIWTGFMGITAIESDNEE